MQTIDWGKLWELATGEAGGDAKIEPTADPELVILHWPDGSRGYWFWKHGEWNPDQEYNSAPCDVAARDSL